MTHRHALAMFTAALLLAPSLLQALAWNSVNFLVALASVFLLVVLVRRWPAFQFIFAAVLALPIAIAPYPNWLWASNDLGWHFHVGEKLGHLGDYGLELALLYIVAALLLSLLAWAVRPNNSFKPKPLRGSA